MNHTNQAAQGEMRKVADSAGQWLIQHTGSLRAYLPRLIGWLRELGPYAAIELLLPGGSLIVLLVWLYRRSNATRCGNTARGCA